MSLDEARQIITCWLNRFETVDPIDLTEERFAAAIASDQRLSYDAARSIFSSDIKAIFSVGEPAALSH